MEEVEETIGAARMVRRYSPADPSLLEYSVEPFLLRCNKLGEGHNALGELQEPR
jgi:hypothetical protein